MIEEVDLFPTRWNGDESCDDFMVPMAFPFMSRMLDRNLDLCRSRSRFRPKSRANKRMARRPDECNSSGYSVDDASETEVEITKAKSAKTDEVADSLDTIVRMDSESCVSTTKNV